MMKLATVMLTLTLPISAIELTNENWDVQTSGKLIFVKFFAPWCGHCKALKPDWEQLMHEFDGSSSKLIATVDCTTEEELCSAHGIEGFPTLKYGDADDLQVYEGGRSLEELMHFVEENLKATCGVKNIELCESDKKAEIEKYMKMPLDELYNLVDVEEKKIQDASDNFEAELEKLREHHEAAMNVLQEVIEQAKKNRVSLMKHVLKSKESSEAQEKIKEEL